MALRRPGNEILHLIRGRTSIPILILTLILCTPLICPAQVQVRLRVIQASNVGANVDPSLRDLHKELGSLFNFTSYRLVRDQMLSLSPNQPAALPVHEGRSSIEITQVGSQRNIVELKVRIKRDGTDILNTQVRLSPGRTVLIGGPKHGEGVVILGLSVNF
jgi:ABC-type uncharacterized transport system fused permease/ATPase subunit